MVSAPYFKRETDRWAAIVKLKPVRLKGSSQNATSWNRRLRLQQIRALPQ